MLTQSMPRYTTSLLSTRLQSFGESISAQYTGMESMCFFVCVIKLLRRLKTGSAKSASSASRILAFANELSNSERNWKEDMVNNGSFGVFSINICNTREPKVGTKDGWFFR
uniref:Uncharacterized protein n=1 Tax=Anopheles albimanus TaxID=7167 RepID=A0A182FYI8_ANOAL